MQPVGKRGTLAASPKRLPGTLTRVLAGRVPLPSRDAVTRLLATERMDIGGLDQPVSRARDGDPAAPIARYFVIHDTSTPYYGDEPFPADIDGDARVNSFRPYFPAECRPGKIPGCASVPQPHRAGAGRPAPVAAVARDQARDAGDRAAGEGPVPSRRNGHAPPPRSRNRRVERRHRPKPGFSARQYDRLAILYIALSVRAGAWLIPAQHATMDHGLPQAHDDPQNFRIKDFDRALHRRLRALPRG